MIVFERAIKFEEVDAAAIVFFARFVNFAHEAMEHFFSHVPGGYAGLIVGRRVGFPAVHLDASFAAPVRFGDALRIETRVAKLGNRSAVFHYRMLNAASGELACELRHTIVSSDLRTITSCDMPADVRALLAQHLEPGGP